MLYTNNNSFLLRFMAVITPLCLAPVMTKSLNAAAPQPTPLNEFVDDMTWMSGKWTDDEKPYVAVEQEIVRLQKQGVDLRKKLPAYRVAAMANLTNRPNLYRWAYATHRVVPTLDEVLSFGPRSPLWKGIYEAMMRPASPDRYIYGDANYQRLYKSGKLPKPVRSYYYSRLLFIAAIHQSYAEDRGRLPALKKLGDRLLQRNPRDMDVKALCVELANIGRITGGKFYDREPKKALLYAQQLVRDNPKNLSYLLVLAKAQDNNWDFKKDNSGADRVVATYQRYLKLAPAKARYRSVPSYRIKSIEKSKQFWTKWRAKNQKT